MARLFSSAALAAFAEGQIRVMAPNWLKNSDVLKRSGKQGIIEGSTAVFGAPFYGDHVVGRLVYGESQGNVHCTEDDYELPMDNDYERGHKKLVKECPTDYPFRSETASDCTHPSCPSEWKGPCCDKNPDRLCDDYCGENCNDGAWHQNTARMINIAVVRRGKCSFTTKAKVAQAKGAHALIIVDREDSTMTLNDIRNIIVGDDGFGGTIHIPTILISKEEGKEVMRAAEKGQGIVELAWTVPPDHIVQLDLWMSSGSEDSQNFLKQFAPARKALNEVMHFTPHYHIFSMPSSDPSVYQGLCSDTTGQFCAEDPDGAGEVTGKDVLEEDVRQLCIHETHAVPLKFREEIAEKAYEAAEAAAEEESEAAADKRKKAWEKLSEASISYSGPFWDYVSQFPDKCKLNAKEEANRFGFTCSENLMKELGMDTQKISRCIMETRDTKLKDQRDHAAWSPRALRINGWRYSGMLEPDLITRAVCSAFVIKPIECETMIGKRDHFGEYKGGNVGLLEEQVSGGEFISGLVAVLGLTALAFCCYRQAMKASLQNQVREEVMLEVQSAMAQYNRMQGHD
jgi:hypothetical protein